MNYVISLLKEIITRRRLIWDLSKADFKKRFVGSYFGVVWMFVQPVVTVLIYWLIFGPIGFKSAQRLLCTVAGPRYRALVFLCRGLKLRHRLSPGIQLPGEEGRV